MKIYACTMINAAACVQAIKNKVGRGHYQTSWKLGWLFSLVDASLLLLLSRPVDGTLNHTISQEKIFVYSHCNTEIYGLFTISDFFFYEDCTF